VGIVVVDTNVWMAASGLTEQADPPCATACLDALERLRDADTLALDAQRQIENEYFDNLPRQSFSHMLLGELLASGRIEFKACDWSSEGIALVPPTLADLDPSDHKFAAVALTYDPPAPIYNAVDTDWCECAAGLAAAGLEVIELCPQCLR